MKFLLLLASLAGLLAATVQVQPAGAAPSSAAVAYYDGSLAAQAQAALNASKFESSTLKPEYANVQCYDSERAFDGATWWRTGDDPTILFAYYERANHTIYLRPSICAGAARFVNKVKAGRSWNVTRGEAGAFSILLHEAMHRQGIHNERRATCLANDAVRWAAMNLGASQGEGNRLSRVAFDFSAKYVASSYRSVSGSCQTSLARSDWTDFIGV